MYDNMEKVKQNIIEEIKSGKLDPEHALSEITKAVCQCKIKDTVADITNNLICVNPESEATLLFFALAESYIDSLQNSSTSCLSCLNHSLKDASLESCGKSKRKNKGGSKKQDSYIPGLVKSVKRGACILWFRRDLRLKDNAALFDACENYDSVIPVFLWSPLEEGNLSTGGATKFWLENSLKSLRKSLRTSYSSTLIVRKCDNISMELVGLIRATNAKKVCWTALYEPEIKKRDDTIMTTLKKMCLDVQTYHSYLLYRPDKVQTEGVGLRGIGSVTHFLEACRLNSPGPIGDPLPKPGIIPIPSSWPSSDEIEDLGLYAPPRRKDGTLVDWAANFRQFWKFGEEGAHQNLENFLSEGIKNYEKESCRSDMPNTAIISPYLHFGEISSRSVLSAAMFTDLGKSPKFQRKLAWRDLAYWLYYIFPTMNSEPVRPPFKFQRWSKNKVSLRAWQKGDTGYPLVDAAMQQLWQVGWMNNYMRHVVASFLISYLHISWEEGFKWFQDTLVDADVAINAMMWQNGGFSGFDQWNFVMHPVDAALTCDPKGDYVRKWIPKLKDLPDEFIHQPWKCPPSILRRYGITLGVTYPNRIIVDLHEAREQSLRDVTLVRRKFAKGYIDKHTGNDIVPIPAKILLPVMGASKDHDLLDEESGRLLIPVITRKEFKYRMGNPEAKDNPYNAVLKGYVSRKRDEAIIWANQNDFTASTINEATLRAQRYSDKDTHNSSRRTHNKDRFSSV
ncbi:deoxyribodipyrimidine photo-lyase-like isoform X2 [Artemia franciscana]|uniref:deoxyribodipyrimidine photo-lyase-like isoform X2 n=1 Tax=Artemia franciscana TaxID=6661 RepID=UPI0032DB16EB